MNKYHINIQINTENPLSEDDLFNIKEFAEEKIKELRSPIPRTAGKFYIGEACEPPPAIRHRYIQKDGTVSFSKPSKNAKPFDPFE